MIKLNATHTLALVDTLTGKEVSVAGHGLVCKAEQGTLHDHMWIVQLKFVTDKSNATELLTWARESYISKFNSLRGDKS